jgi:imidazole glycerol-phosphate synthase subunit HisH
MIAIIDYGCGNTGSLKNMLHKNGAEATITSCEKKIRQADAIILPGVGAFDSCASSLENSGLKSILNELVLKKEVPFLGICVGMQLLFDHSEEGSLPGLGWISGNVKRFSLSNTNKRSLRVPHMGWNKIKFASCDGDWLSDIDNSRFYFVHSYHAVCEDKNDILATCDYGYEFACMVRKKNIIGVQFHPEKSHKYGLNFFKNFIKKIYQNA